MTIDLTGLNYEDWERNAAEANRAAERSERTGLLDARHLEELRHLDEAVAEELEIVEDVCDLSDPETAVELGPVRQRLAVLRDRIQAAGLRMRRVTATRGR